MILSEKVNEFIRGMQLKKSFLGGIREDSVYENMRKISEIYEQQIHRLQEQLETMQAQSEADAQRCQEIQALLEGLREQSRADAQRCNALREQAEARERLLQELKRIHAKELQEIRSGHAAFLRMQQSRVQQMMSDFQELSKEVGDALEQGAAQ